DSLGYLVSLDDGLPQVPNLESYFRILKEKAARRRLIFACENLKSRCSLGSEGLAGIIAEGQELFASVGLDSRAQGYRSVNDLPFLDECGAVEIEYIREPELPK